MHGVLSGSYFTSAASLGARLFPRVKFAQFASAALAVGSIATMTLTPLMGTVIDLTGNVYRLTYVLGAITAFLALLIGGYVHMRFMQLGGSKGYVPPEE
jgi:MFS-type transporter involved in bile tolerance (Atg22 family)